MTLAFRQGEIELWGTGNAAVAQQPLTQTEIAICYKPDP